MEQAGLNARIPTVCTVQEIVRLDFATSASADAITSLGVLASLTPEQRSLVLREVARALRPGQPFVFVERVSDTASPLRPLLAGSSDALELADLEAVLQESGQWTFMEYDIVLAGQDPHAAGFAVRGDESNAPLEGSKSKWQNSKDRRRSTSTSRGFS